MKEVKSFLVVHRASGDKRSDYIINTKNCTKFRAMRLWKKYLRSNYGYPIGVYAVAHTRGRFTVKKFNIVEV